MREGLDHTVRPFFFFREFLWPLLTRTFLRVILVHKMTRTDIQVLTFVRSYIAENGYAPSFEEIRKATDISLSTVHASLGRLSRYGYLKYQPKRPRTIILTKKEVRSES